MRRRLAILGPLVALWGCDKPLEGERSACDPLDPNVCASPYPSNFYLKDDPATTTGKRVDFAANTLPMNRDYVQVKPDYFNEKDGFSTHGPFLVALDDASLDGVVGHTNLDDYAAPDAKVLLIDTSTGERIPVWAELDNTGLDNFVPQPPAERLFMIWPTRQLEFNRTYVVGLRGLTNSAGAPIAPSAAFAALRDDDKTDDYDVEFRRERFDAVVFPALEAAGAPRADLQLAWDFTTVSRQSSLGRMEKIRDEGLALVDQGITYHIEDQREFDCSTDHIARDFIVSADIPSFMEDSRPGNVLNRDEAGMPFVTGTMEAEYLVRIPCSVAEGAVPARVMNYGHGMLGGYDEAYTGWLAEFADEAGFIIVAHTWFGMSDDDVPAITVAMVNDPSDFVVVPERSHQGFFAAMAGMRLIKTQLVNDAAFKFPDADGDLVSVIDPNKLGYYGISQGGIMGGALVAMSPDLDRGVLGVPGAPYTMLLWRSRNFGPFFDIFRQKFEDHRDISLMIALLEMLWEPAEAGGWLNDLRDDPSKRVLMQPAIGDPQVTTLGAELMARTIGAKSITPAARPIWQVDETAAPYEGNAIVEFAYAGSPASESEPVDNVPQETAADTHECPRRDDEGQAQIIEFLNTGVVAQHCVGVCGSDDVADPCLDFPEPE